MTEKVFWQDPYLTRLDTVITSVSERGVTVAQTIFYAFSGGQESDTGTIAAHPVLEARKEGIENTRRTEIVYTLDDAHDLRPGDPVTMTIDWGRRYRLMRLHFAAEIVLELSYRELNPIQKIGAHIAENKARIDFEWGESIAPALSLLEEQANGLITANHPIVSAFSDAENERRYWEIDGFARVACGGTHLRSTGEVGAVELKRKNIGKGKERIEIYLAQKVE